LDRRLGGPKENETLDFEIPIGTAEARHASLILTNFTDRTNSVHKQHSDYGHNLVAHLKETKQDLKKIHKRRKGIIK
jgi:hypothetical protein